MLIINMTQEQQIIITNNNINTTTIKLKLGKFARLRLRHHQLRTVSPMNNTQSCNCEHGNMMAGEEATVGDNYQETAGAPVAADLAKNVIFINVVANHELSHEKANGCAKINDGDDDQLQLHTKHNGHQPAQQLECKLATNELDEHNENLRKLPSPQPPRPQTFYSCCHQSPTGSSSSRHHTQSSHKKDENNDEQRIGKHPIEQQEQHKYSNDHNHRLPTLAAIAAVDDRDKCRPINMLCPSRCALANSSPRLKNLLFLISLIVSIQVYHQLNGTNVGATLINNGAGSSSKHLYSTSLFDSNNDNNYHSISKMNVEQTGLLVSGGGGGRLVDAANDLLATIYSRGGKMMMIKPPTPPPTNYNGDGGEQTTSSNKKEPQRNDDDEHTQFKLNDDQSRRSDVDCSSLSSAAATLACGSRFANRRKRQPTGADCNKLTASWLIIQSTYPTLARRLLDWADTIAARAHHDRDQTPLAWARRLGHQLEEAERLVAGDELIAQLHQHHNQNQQQQTSPSAAWLARVSSRPGYARLLQQLRTKHVHQTPRSSGATQSDAPLPPADATATDSGHIEASHQLDGHSAAGSHAFGKIIQYPHEISTGGSGDDGDNVDLLGGVAQTFEKLRLLNRHNRLQQQSEQQQQQQPQLHNQDTQPNEIEQQQLQHSEQPEFERNNKIPAQQSLGADVFHLEQQQQPNWKKALELADSARSRIVYGNVLLQPINKQINDHQLKHQGSVENLHELANHERILGYDNNNNKNSDHHTLMTSGGGEHMVEGGNGGQKSASQQQLTAGQLITASQTIAATPPAPPSSPLPPLIRPKFNEEPTETNSRAIIGSMNNPFGSDSELISQQQAEQMAANGADQLDGNEFEGTFHSGPLDKVAEVRQLRSLSTPSAIVGDHNRNNQHQQRMENDRQLSPAKNSGNSFVVD